MSSSTPNITIPVDLTNPGQFFACCGLLELADRIWPRAEVMGGFTSPRFDRSRFDIFATSAFCVAELLRALLDCCRRSVDPYQPIMGFDGKPVKDMKKIKPVMFGGSVSLRLSWWLDELTGRQTSFKTWSAHKTAEGLIHDMARAICVNEIENTNVLQLRVGMTSRLGLDTRSSWNTLDEGFSPNDQNLPVDTYPATEILASIGLETFRPASSGDRYTYTCWTTPMPTTVARAVASGSINIQGTIRYGFHIGSRGKFKFFTKALLLERNING